MAESTFQQARDPSGGDRAVAPSDRFGLVIEYPIDAGGEPTTDPEPAGPEPTNGNGNGATPCADCGRRPPPPGSAPVPPPETTPGRGEPRRPDLEAPAEGEAMKAARSLCADVSMFAEPVFSAVGMDNISQNMKCIILLVAAVFLLRRI